MSERERERVRVRESVIFTMYISKFGAHDFTSEKCCERSVSCNVPY